MSVLPSPTPSSDISADAGHSACDSALDHALDGACNNACIGELKTRARLGLKALQAGDQALLDRAARVSGVRMAVPTSWKLRHAFTLVVRSVGFRTWAQARAVLGGQAQAGDDMGSFWHAPRCHGLLNHWFAHYDDALVCLHKMPGHALVPYRRQFIVVNEPYLNELGLNDVLAAQADEALDLVALYGSDPWQALCWSRLRAHESTWVR